MRKNRKESNARIWGSGSGAPLEKKTDETVHLYCGSMRVVAADVFGVVDMLRAGGRRCRPCRRSKICRSRRRCLNPLVDDDGQKITTPQQWKERREQMKRILEYYALATVHRRPRNFVGHELKTRQLDGGKVNYRLVHLAFGPAESLGFDIAIFIPAPTEMAKPPFATIIQPSFFPTPGGPPIKAAAAIVRCREFEGSFEEGGRSLADHGHARRRRQGICRTAAARIRRRDVLLSAVRRGHARLPAERFLPGVPWL